MKQTEDARTLELPGLSPVETGNGGGMRRAWPIADVVTFEDTPGAGWKCPACGGLSGTMFRPKDGPPRPYCEHCGHEAKPTRGAYAGAVKLGCHAHALRARTGRSQAEIARLAGVSERSVRTWDAARDPAREAPKVHAAIVAALARLGVTYALPAARQVRYRDPMTGSTWSGRGLKPRWLVVALDDGAKLADFAC